MMRARFAIVMPLPVLAWIIDLPAPPLTKPVQTESIRAARLDETTFRARWAPIADLPPATVVRIVEREVVATEPELEPAPVLHKPTHIRRASLDVCARHGMRKVNYGKRWRCR
jgi:hypothetical protein